MIDFDEALERIFRRTRRLPPLKIRITDALGFVLAKEMRAREPIPRFDSSSVDGFAVRFQDIANASKENPVRLVLGGTSQAGSSAHASLTRGSTIRIMTGALLPKNTDAVVMKEHVSHVGKKIVFVSPSRVGENIRKRGEEFRKGETVFPRGTLITPPVIGMPATLGFTTITVYRKPRIALIVTGNELRRPMATLRPGQIRDSNSFALASALRGFGIEPILTLHARDTKAQIAEAFARALKEADVVVSAGGVSVGEFDFVKQVLSDLRVETVFWRVAMKPGMPNYVGTRGTRIVFGLPGNPVSALVSFEVLVIPALMKMMGRHSPALLSATAVLDSDLRKNAGRVEFVRAVVSRAPDGQWVVKPSRGQGSHMTSGLADANCLIVFPKMSEKIEKGESVAIRMLSWNR